MPIVEHKFIDHQLNPNTKYLIIGTFNPNVNNNEADFFYGRNRNFLWKLLPLAFGEIDLKQADLENKMAFIQRNDIDFIDLIKSIEIENGQENNYLDNYIDGIVVEWNAVLYELKKLPNLLKVAFTRSTFQGIPNIHAKILEIQNYCQDNNIDFACLKTPARYYNQEKQNIWNIFFEN